MNHDDVSFGAPEPLTTEEAAELANTLTPEQLVKYRAMSDKSWQDQLTEAYAEGRADGAEATALECIEIVAMHGGSVEIEAAIRQKFLKDEVTV